MAKKTDGMFSAGKIGKQIGVSAPKVKKAIEQLGVEPDLVYCGCNYYTEETMKKIEKTVKEG